VATNRLQQIGLSLDEQTASGQLPSVAEHAY